MLIVGFFSWWYGRGWVERAQLARRRIAGIFDYFSIDLLLKTYFSPFRQISAGSVSGPIAVQMRAFFDQMISRVIGATVRTFMIIFGALAIIVTLLAELVMMIGWGIIPFTPLIGFVLMTLGWLPWL